MIQKILLLFLLHLPVKVTKSRKCLDFIAYGICSNAFEKTGKGRKTSTRKRQKKKMKKKQKQKSRRRSTEFRRQRREKRNPSPRNCLRFYRQSSLCCCRRRRRIKKLNKSYCLWRKKKKSMAPRVRRNQRIRTRTMTLKRREKKQSRNQHFQRMSACWMSNEGWRRSSLRLKSWRS